MDSAFGKKLDDLKRAFCTFAAHFSSRYARTPSCSALKLHVTLSLLCAGHTLLSDIDNSLHLTLNNITNVNIRDEQWRQASFLVKARYKCSECHVHCTISILVIVSKHSTTASSAPKYMRKVTV